MTGLIDRLRELIEAIDRRFEGKALQGPWETISTFLFSEGKTTPLAGPHLRDNTDLKRYMSVVMFAAAPTLVASIYLFGWRSLALTIFCYVFGIFIEMGFAAAKREEVTEGMFVTCILYPMILPPTIPFWMAGVGLAVGLILGKEVFGGTGKNIFNPAIVGRVFIAVTFPVHMASRWYEPYTGFPGGFAHWSKTLDAVTTATPLIGFKGGEPANITDMIIGTTAGSLGETSAVLIILGGLFLVASRVANWRLPLATIAAAMAMATAMYMADSTAYASPLYHLAGGGLLFGAFFMVTDPVSCPLTPAGKWVYGALIGVVTVVIRNLSGFPEGMMFAILFMNMFSPVIDDAVLSLKYGKGGEQ